MDADVHRLLECKAQYGEVSELVPERVWREFSRALIEKAPQKFFETLIECDAARVIMPEITDLTNLINSVELTDAPHIRFAALTQLISVDEVKALCDRLHAPVNLKIWPC